MQNYLDFAISLPMSKPAIITGSVIADVLKNGLAAIVMVLTGLLVGFRPEAGVMGWVYIAILLAVLSFALSWMFAFIGLRAKSYQFVQQAGFLFLFPLTFVSSAFVPTSTMPDGLRVFAENQPITLMVEAIRSLIMNQPAGNDALYAILWCVGITAVFFPLTVILFKRQSR
jgi:ABC-type polysaccharide/polyol phosphate export permease